jgi:hypothetical protein
MYSEDILKSALFECPPLRTYSCGAPHRLDLNLENNKKGRGDPSCLPYPLQLSSTRPTPCSMESTLIVVNTSHQTLFMELASNGF